MQLKSLNNYIPQKNTYKCGVWRSLNRWNLLLAIISFGNKKEVFLILILYNIIGIKINNLNQKNALDHHNSFILSLAVILSFKNRRENNSLAAHYRADIIRYTLFIFIIFSFVCLFLTITYIKNTKLTTAAKKHQTETKSTVKKI